MYRFAFKFAHLLVFLLNLSTIYCEGNNRKCDDNFSPMQWEQINSHLDETASPCDDFYKYACGNWRTPIHLHALRARDTLTALKAENKHQLIKYLADAPRQSKQQKQPEIPIHRQFIIEFYHSCMDKAFRSDSRGRSSSSALRRRSSSTTSTSSTIIEPSSIGSGSHSSVYMNHLLRLGNWPLLSGNFVESQFDWPTMNGHLGRYGAPMLWQLRVQANWQSSDQMIFYVVPLAFDLLRNGLNPPDTYSLVLYKRYVKYLMLSLGQRIRRSLQLAEEVVEFEWLFYNKTILQTGTADSIVLPEPQTLSELDRDFPVLRLRQYFEILLANVTTNQRMEKDQLLIVADRVYLRKLENFMRTISLDSLAKFMLVQFLAHFEVHLHDGESFAERKDYCLQELNSFLPEHLSLLFLELQTHGETAEWQNTIRNDLSTLFQQLKVQFEGLLNATHIFDRDAMTKALGMQKVRAMRLLLPQFKTADELPKTGFEFHNNYDENLLSLWLEKTRIEFETTMQLRDGGGSTLLSAAVYGPLEVNAFYRLKKNAVELPIGLLRTPFYDACLPPARLYGGLMYILAHELLHGFDYDGFNYDQSGNIATDNNSWGAKSIIQFGVKSSCYMTERYHNAARAINENIADNEGLHLALETWRHQNQYENKNPNENENENISNEESPFDAEQLKMFFLTFAQTWCYRDDDHHTHRDYSIHADHRERVNNVIGNFPEFMQAFKCTAKSEMNPIEKCRIW